MRGFVLLVTCLAVVACSESSQPERPQPARATSPASSGEGKARAKEPAPARRRAAYAVAERSDAELAAELDAACAEARAQGRPWLIEVSAPWCGDCRALAALETQPPLAEELSKWTRVQVNIGDFDRHDALREWLGLRAIAHWAVLEPRECDPALGRSPIVLQRTLEPRSGVPVDAPGLAEWLADARDTWRLPGN